MKIIFSPAKQMKFEFGPDPLKPNWFPKESQILFDFLSQQSIEQLQSIYRCSPAIAKQAKGYWEDFSFEKQLSPALFAFDGIAYTYLDPKTLSQDELLYLEEHLRILSAFYGILTPRVGINKYRLEMGQKLPWEKSNSLYGFWGNKLYQALYQDENVILNLASEEYASIIRKYLKENNRFIDVGFYEEDKGKLVEKGVYCKMARGKLVAYLAKNKIENPEEIKKWSEMNYVYNESLSSPNKIVFIRKQAKLY